MTAFRNDATAFAEANAQVLGVSVDSWAAADAFREKLGCEFPLLGDWPRYETGKAYGVYNEEANRHNRMTFVLDKDHVVRHIVDEAREMERHAAESLEHVRQLA